MVKWYHVDLAWSHMPGQVGIWYSVPGTRYQVRVAVSTLLRYSRYSRYVIPSILSTGSILLLYFLRDDDDDGVSPTGSSPT